ncbi:MAG: NAD(P)/FAD-dependent oxidoreductase [Actinomycetota bacterium]|mgnify:FL=1|nr:NAD(P)/FAD-dependent oxidoreductase [Actinomycetota bacterium]
MDNEPELDHDVIVVGAGVAGIYQIKRLTDMGLNATVLEADPDLGGTWYNNRYPGARFDSESYTYGYSFSREVLDEWHWKEMFSGQPENLKYLNFVVDKFDLRQYMQFNCRVQSAIFDDDRQIWNVTVSDDRELSCRFLVLALGLLSQPTMPRIPGVDDFQGRSWHTYGWPHEEVDLSDQRVGIIGTGATAIQVIGEIADKVGELTVFQRRPNWVAPLNNSDISAEQMVGIRDRYDEIFETCARTPGGFEHEPDRRGFYEVTAEERYQLWDRLYEEPGFSIWLRNFREIFTDEKANAELSEYMAERIRGRVTDPVVAEKLVPKDHGFGVQRVPMETNYLEAYNRENVHLVDINETPLVRVTDKGIRTTAQDYEFDVIVYATGFDAITGSFDHIDIRGRNGLTLREKWFDNPSTFLGMLVSGFPNLLMPSGPQSGSASTNYPRGIENGVNWCTDFFEYMRSRDLRYFEATEDAEKRWTEHVVKMYSVMLMRKAQSWFTGYNSNVEGHEAGKVRYLVYNGGTPKYVATINDVAAKDYEGIRFDVDSKMPRDVLAAG